MTLVEKLGGEAGCARLATDFYARVAGDPVLKPLFPGQSLRCATEEFTAFLLQFLGSDGEATQKRWWLSLRESHGRFAISETQRQAWLRLMQAAIEASPLSAAVRLELNAFFREGSACLLGHKSAAMPAGEWASRWAEQTRLEDAIAAIVAGHDEEALQAVARFQTRRVVFAGLLVRLMRTGRPALVEFVVRAVATDATLIEVRFSAWPLLHHAAAEGCLPAVEALLRQGADANALDRGWHTPLSAVANGCGSAAGVAIVRALVNAGADVKACGGVTRATPLHMAARRGFTAIAEELLACGADAHVRDARGVTPHQRALRCRQAAVARLLAEA